MLQLNREIIKLTKTMQKLSKNSRSDQSGGRGGAGGGQSHHLPLNTPLLVVTCDTDDGTGGDNKWESACNGTFIWQAATILCTLLKAVPVHDAVVESPTSTSDFSLVSTPRISQTAELTATRDNSMY